MLCSHFGTNSVIDELGSRKEPLTLTSMSILSGRKKGDGPRISIDGTQLFFHENLVECHENSGYDASKRKTPRKKWVWPLVRFIWNQKNVITLFLVSASSIVLGVHFIKCFD